MPITASGVETLPDDERLRQWMKLRALKQQVGVMPGPNVGVPMPPDQIQLLDMPDQKAVQPAPAQQPVQPNNLFNRIDEFLGGPPSQKPAAPPAQPPAMAPPDQIKPQVGVAPAMPIGVAAPSAQFAGGWGQDPSNRGNMQVGQAAPDAIGKILQADAAKAFPGMTSPQREAQGRQAIGNMDVNKFVAMQTGNMAMLGSGETPVMPHGYHMAASVAPLQQPAGTAGIPGAGTPSTQAGLGAGFHLPGIGGAGTTTLLPSFDASGRASVASVNRPNVSAPQGEYGAIAQLPVEQQRKQMEDFLNSKIGVGQASPVGVMGAMAGAANPLLAAAPAALASQQMPMNQQQAMQEFGKMLGYVSPADREQANKMAAGELHNKGLADAAKIGAEAEVKKGEMHLEGERLKAGLVGKQMLAQINADRLSKGLPPLSGEAQAALLRMNEEGRQVTSQTRGGAVSPSATTMPTNPAAALKSDADVLATDQRTTDQMQRVVNEAMGNPVQGAAGVFNPSEGLRSLGATTGLGPEQHKWIIDQLLAAKGGPNKDELSRQMMKEMVRYSSELGTKPFGTTTTGPFTVKRYPSNLGLWNNQDVLDAQGNVLHHFGNLPSFGITGAMQGTSDLMPTIGNRAKNDYQARLTAAQQMLQAMGY